MNNKLFLVAMVLCLSLLAFWLGQQFHANKAQQAAEDGLLTIHRAKPQAMPKDGREQSSADSMQHSIDAPNTQAPATKINAPLPPQDAPLAENFDALKQQALAGNRRATCRLAKELMHCKNQALNQQAHEMLLSMASKKPDKDVLGIGTENNEAKPNEPDPMIDILAKTEEHIDQGKKLCQNLTPEQMAQTYAMQQLGVQQGIATIQADYLTQPALPQKRYLDDLAGWQDYRNRSPDVAEALLQQGNVNAVRWLAQAYAERPSIAHQVPFSLNDPMLAATYALLHQRLHPNIHPGHPMHLPLSTELTAEQRAQAQQEADQLAHTYFADHASDNEAPSSRLTLGEPPASACQNIDP